MKGHCVDFHSSIVRAVSQAVSAAAVWSIRTPPGYTQPGVLTVPQASMVHSYTTYDR